jgi:hypothetical protein
VGPCHGWLCTCIVARPGPLIENARAKWCRWCLGEPASGDYASTQAGRAEAETELLKNTRRPQARESQAACGRLPLSMVDGLEPVGLMGGCHGWLCTCIVACSGLVGDCARASWRAPAPLVIARIVAWCRWCVEEPASGEYAAIQAVLAAMSRCVREPAASGRGLTVCADPPLRSPSRISCISRPPSSAAHPSTVGGSHLRPRPTAWPALHERVFHAREFHRPRCRESVPSPGPPIPLVACLRHPRPPASRVARRRGHCPGPGPSQRRRQPWTSPRWTRRWRGRARAGGLRRVRQAASIPLARPWWPRMLRRVQGLDGGGSWAGGWVPRGASRRV